MATRQKRRAPANVRTFSTGGTATHSDSRNYRERFVVYLDHTNNRRMTQLLHAVQSYGGLVQMNVVDESHGAITLEGSKRILAYLLGHPAILRYEYAMSIRVPFVSEGASDEDAADKARKQSIQDSRARPRKKGIDQRPNERKR